MLQNGLSYNPHLRIDKQRYISADIEDVVIIGMDIMTRFKFKLDLKVGVLEVDNEEVNLHGHEDASVRETLIAQNTCCVFFVECPNQFQERKPMVRIGIW